jgi:hypothetical protein
MRAACLREQIKPSRIVAARRHAVEVENAEGNRRRNIRRSFGLTISGDIATWPPENPSLRLV